MLPDFVSEENEPDDIEEDGADEKDGVCAAEALTAALDCDEGEQCNGQIYQQNPGVQCTKRSHQCAPNLYIHTYIKGSIFNMLYESIIHSY